MDDFIEQEKILKLTNHYDDWINSHKIVSVTFEITSKCNLECVHCYMCGLRKEKDQLTYEQIIKILDILYDHGVLSVTFSGGEPFVRNDFKDIYLYAKHKGFLVSIFTNGTLIDEEWIKIFNEYPPLLVDLSIYGASEDAYEKVTRRKGVYSSFIKALNLLRDADVRFAIKAPLMTLNYKELKAMRDINNRYSKENFRYSYDMAPDRMNSLEPRNYEIDPLTAVLIEIEEGSNFDRLTQKGQEREEWDYARENAKFYPVYSCSVGKFRAHIDYLGNVAACIECTERYNIFEMDFDSIVNRFQKYEEIEAKPNYKCINCKVAMFCSSCPQVRKRVYGDEHVIKNYDCVVAELKYKYYVEKLSVEELKVFYKKYMKEV